MNKPSNFPILTNTTCNDAYVMNKALGLVFDEINDPASTNYTQITKHFRFAEAGGALVVQYSSTGSDPWTNVADIAVP